MTCLTLSKGGGPVRLGLVFLASVVPGLLWVWFFYRQDRVEKEPPGLIAWTFAAGMLAVVPAALWEAPFRELLVNPPGPVYRFLASVFVVGFGEEGVKLLAAYLVAFRHRAFNEPADGIIYAATASLGFASLENVLYTLAFGLEIAPVRAVVTTLAHASFGGVAGLHLGLSLREPERRLALVAQGLALAALLHGLYDYLIIARLAHPLVALVIVYGSYRYVAAKLRALGAAFRRRW